MPITHIAGASVEGLPLSEAVRAGDFLFVSGMVGFNEAGDAIVDGGIGEETRRIMEDLKAILEEAGGDMSRIIKVCVFLTDANDFDAFNQAYATWFPGAKPARIGVVAGMTINAKVEMDFIAYLGD
ncbi:MAG: reactive intermediate/imine deaminase [Rhodospirillaceae bacterium]|nr:reactive intermediate/imine deaminase [Rhodospirillaceae bacterium]|tara:strand:+ start:9355 stop:9732 length:378 start_codon:yes stop_codon:yes gene_type:complete